MFWVVAYLIVGRLVAPRCRLQSSAPAWVGQHSRLWRSELAQLWRGRSVARALRLSALIVAFAMGKTQLSGSCEFYVLALAACKTLAFPASWRILSAAVQSVARAGLRRRQRGPRHRRSPLC